MHAAIASALGIVLSLSFARAQEASLTGPVEGFLFDVPTRSFRAVLGFPGSASLGAAVLNDFDYGSVAPHKNYGIALKDGQCILVSALGSQPPSTLAISGTAGRPEGVVWSGDGSLAVLYSRSGNWIQTLAGLPDAPMLSDSVDVSPLGGALIAVASDVTGKYIAIGVAGDSGGVYLMTGGQGFAPALQIAKPVALSFSADSAKLYAVDAAAIQLAELTVADGITRSLALDGLADPIAVRSVPDPANGFVLCLIGRSDRLLRVYDSSSYQVIANVPLDFSPTGIGDLGRSSFVISSRAKDTDPLWLFTSAPQRAVYFVPALVAGGLP